MSAFKIFSRFAELLDIKTTRSAATWLRLNADGTATERSASSTLDDLGGISAMTADGKYGPRGKYELAPQTISLQISLETAIAPIFRGRYSSVSSFGFGSLAGQPAQIVFVPFFVYKDQLFTRCAVAVTAGASATDVLYGGIYLPDANGFPSTLHGSVWQWAVTSAVTVEATITAPTIQGLFYVGLLPSKGAADWTADNGDLLRVRGCSEAQANAGFQEVFNSTLRSLAIHSGSVGILHTGPASTLPADLSSPEIRRPAHYSFVTHPVCVLY